MNREALGKSAPPSSLLIEFNEPIEGILLKRYKRFFADVQLSDGSVVTAHCTNTGSMATVCEVGQPVVVSRATNPERKLKYTWELIHCGGGWVGVNTAQPNHLVHRALGAGLIKEFKPLGDIRTEIVIKKGVRLDLSFEEERGHRYNSSTVFIEVKNVSLKGWSDSNPSLELPQKRPALFPDSVSERATKHLLELFELAQKGHRAVIFYVVQRLDCNEVQPAQAIDPIYAKTLHEVTHPQWGQKPIETIAYSFSATPRGIAIAHRLPVTTQIGFKKGLQEGLT